MLAFRSPNSPGVITTNHIFKKYPLGIGLSIHYVEVLAYGSQPSVKCVLGTSFTHFLCGVAPSYIKSDLPRQIDIIVRPEHRVLDLGDSA